MRAELEGVASRLLVFAAALTTLDLVLTEADVEDHLAGFVNPFFLSPNRVAALRAEVVVLPLAFGVRQ